MSTCGCGRNLCEYSIFFLFLKVYATARAEKSEAQCTFMHRARQVVHTVAPEFSLAKLSRLLKPKAIPIPTIML